MIGAMESSMARQTAWRWALFAFVVTIVRGLMLSVGFDATLRFAMGSLIVVYGLGLICAALWKEAFE
jgi:hypothetical protein